MPSWQAYKEEAKARGALALELVVVKSVPAGPPETLRAVLPDHLAYQRQLEESGQLALAGPVSDPSGELMEGAGLIVYRVATMADARALADADPMHSSGARQYTLCRWLINEGSLNPSVGLSTKGVSMT
jgi:uncharacterized protein YciI